MSHSVRSSQGTVKNLGVAKRRRPEAFLPTNGSEGEMETAFEKAVRSQVYVPGAGSANAW